MLMLYISTEGGASGGYSPKEAISGPLMNKCDKLNLSNLGENKGRVGWIAPKVPRHLMTMGTVVGWVQTFCGGGSRKGGKGVAVLKSAIRVFQ